MNPRYSFGSFSVPCTSLNFHSMIYVPRKPPGATTPTLCLQAKPVPVTLINFMYIVTLYRRLDAGEPRMGFATCSLHTLLSLILMLPAHPWTPVHRLGIIPTMKPPILQQVTVRFSRQILPSAVSLHSCLSNSCTRRTIYTGTRSWKTSSHTCN